MKYVILFQDIKSDELIARMRYIYDVFKLYTFVDNRKSSDGIIVLNSFPTTSLDLIFIVGHDKQVDAYLQKYSKNISEKYIVIISCCTYEFKSIKHLSNHRVFIPKNGKEVKRFDGNNYGFGFDITDEEILLYRKRKKELDVMLNEVFERRM